MFHLMINCDNKVISNTRDENFEREIFYKLPVSQHKDAIKMSREIDKLGVKLAEAGNYSFVLAAVFHDEDDEFCERSGILKMVTEHNQYEIVRIMARIFNEYCTDFESIESFIDWLRNEMYKAKAAEK